MCEHTQGEKIRIIMFENDFPGHISDMSKHE